MAVNIVGTPVQITEGSDVSYTAESASDRVVVLAGMGESSFSTVPFLGVTLGGVSMTEAQYTGNTEDPKGGVYYILESQIPAGENNFAFDWDGGHQDFIGAAYTLENVNQTSPVNDTGVATARGSETVSFSINTVADSKLIVGAGVHSINITHSLTGTNDASTVTFQEDAKADSVGHHAVALSATSITPGTETVTVDWNDANARSAVAGAVFAPASTGLTITDIDGDNTIVPGETVDITYDGDLSATPTADLYDSSETYSVSLTVNSYDDTAKTINVTIPDPAIDYATDHVLGVTPDGESEVTLSGVTLEPVSGNDSVDVEDPVTDDTSIFYQYTGDAPETGDQIEHDDAANTTVDPDGTFTQDSANNFDARVWDSSDQSWGSWQTIDVSEVIDPPTLTNETATVTGTTTVDASVDTDEAEGTLYAYISANATETQEDVKSNAQETVSVTDTGTQNVSFTGLTEDTSYYVHFMHEDDDTHQSDVATTSQITTDPLPSLSNATATATGSSTASATVDTNKSGGNLYAYASENDTETQTDVKNNAQETQAVTESGEQTVTFTGLTSETSYYIHFLYEDAEDNESDVVTSNQITTDEQAEPSDVLGNVLRNMNYFVNNGGTGYSFNTLAISYYQSVGATSSQFNTALKQAQELVGFVGYSPDDYRNTI